MVVCVYEVGSVVLDNYQHVEVNDHTAQQVGRFRRLMDARDRHIYHYHHVSPYLTQHRKAETDSIA